MEQQVRTWTEAPSSATVRCTLNGYSILFTLRDETGQDLLPKVQAAISALEQMGAQPEGYRGNGHKGNGHNGNGSAGDAPLCPTHGTPMKRSKRGSGWFCPQVVADDDGTGRPVYCKQQIKS
jgi:hypothetical protein